MTVGGRKHTLASEGGRHEETQYIINSFQRFNSTFNTANNEADQMSRKVWNNWKVKDRRPSPVWSGSSHPLRGRPTNGCAHLQSSGIIIIDFVAPREEFSSTNGRFINTTSYLRKTRIYRLNVQKRHAEEETLSECWLRISFSSSIKIHHTYISIGYV